MREGGIYIDHALCGNVCISHRDTLDENLGLDEIEVEVNVLFEYMLDVRGNLEGHTELRLDVDWLHLMMATVAIISVCHSAGILVVLVEGPVPSSRDLALP